MKNIFIILLLIGFVSPSSAQGTIQTTPGANIKMAGNAFIVLENMNVVNNGTFVQTAGNGTIKFTGNADVTISGSSIATFDRLNIDKAVAKKVTLLQSVNVAGQVNFTLGLVDLGASTLNLGTTGMLNGETETARIFTAGNGYVQVVNTLNAPSSANPGNLGAIITSTENLGSVTVKRGHSAQTNVSGTTPGILRYYDIMPVNDNALRATLRFQYFDAELNSLNEATLELWKQSKKNWTYIGSNSRDASNNYVEKTGISAFSRWTLSSGLTKASAKMTDNLPAIAMSPQIIKENGGINDLLTVWPNPVSRSVNVTINVANASLMSLKLYDAKGSLISIREEKLVPGKNFTSIDMTNFAAGNYNLIAEWGTGFKKNKQLIKQ
ncbi:MAG TPA: T9SS type A sorting domain-containing protein [Chitinophagaceae bacterium]|nr:T9SS type A sorting domain-containing protein [Chitinophagaceae bacterium]